MSEGTTSRQTAGSRVSLGTIFRVFLMVGGTSFGGGVVAYLHSALVKKEQWLTPDEFVELLSISQTLPGLNATNMSVLVGDRLRGSLGALVATLGMCIPGGILMLLTGVVYGMKGENPMVTAALRGVAAAAVGLVLATTIQLGRKQLVHIFDLIIVLLSVVCVNVFHWPVPVVVLVVGPLAVFFYRPKAKDVAVKSDE